MKLNMKIRIFALLASVTTLLSCAGEKPSVKADFTVDKMSAQIKEEIMVTNLSVAEFTIIGLCKWEWSDNVSYEYEPTGVYFSEPGDYPITLTVYAEEGVAPSDSYTIVVSVFDSNKAPVAKFTAPENIVQGTPVTFTDMSVDETGYIVDWDWKFGTDMTSTEQNPTVTFDTWGDIRVLLTVTDNYGASGSISQTITVKQSEASLNNQAPAADFSWPQNIIQYMPVVLTDTSSDTDGTVVKWYWEVGSQISREQNPSFTFPSEGEVEVKLTVTDNLGASTTISHNLQVKKTYGHDMKIDWSQQYDDNGFVYWTSPAVTPDGSRIYVSSTGYHLVCFDAQGNKIGSYDIGENGANPYSYKLQHLENQSPTPSIDQDGNVIIAVQFYESPTAESTGNGGVFSIKPDCAGKNWYFATGVKSSYRYLAAPIYGDYVGICLKENDSNMIKENAGVLNRKTGELIQAMTCDQGSFGGMVVTADGSFIYGASRANAGYKVAVRSGNSWTPSANNDAGRTTNYLYNMGETKGFQPAISNDGYIYLCVSANSSTELVCACYKLSNYVAGSAQTPVWTRTITAKSAQCGYGAVLDKEGTPYFMGGDKLVRLNKEDGSVVWECSFAGNNIGVPAIDSYGFLYVCESNNNKLTKIASQTGEILAQIGVSNPKSCPTIAPDGSIYVTGNNNKKPTLYKISGTGECKTVAPGENWSQLAGNPQKTGCATASLK